MDNYFTYPLKVCKFFLAKQNSELRFSPILKSLEYKYCDETITSEMKILTV